MDLHEILACIDEEPEFPGEPEPELEKRVSDAMARDGIDFFVSAMRAAVRLTKKGIAERVKERFVFLEAAKEE